MKESLKGKTILVGRDSEQDRLRVAVSGTAKSAVAGAPGSVPHSVSRCRPEAGTAHCRIDVDPAGNMRLTNLKSPNVTYVDGFEALAKKITSASAVALGRDRFLLDLPTVLAAAARLVEDSQPQEYPIDHLEGVWEEYESSLEAIQRRQQRLGRRRMLPMMLTSASALLSLVAGLLLGPQSCFITIPITFAGFLLCLRNYSERDTSIDDRKAANDRLIDLYVCPNPDCRHFMGNQPYKILRQNKKCPYCGCRFVKK